jgi:transcriptional regulator with XRE-family HTH domain
LAGLADAAGVSKAYLFRLETEASANPSLEMLTRLATTLDVTVAELVGRPMIRLDPSEVDIPTSLKVFADEAGLTAREIEMLASIRWRKGETPRSSERWRFIWNSLKTSQRLDDDHG